MTSGINLYAQWLLIPNTPPARRSGVAATATVNITLNAAYMRDLTTIFEDAEGDPLSLSLIVSIDGASVIAPAAE